jgi:hypothetical protein
MADYAISNVPRRVVYAPSGVGPYAFTFEILAQTDIAVYKGSTLLTLTTDYIVTINANGTGSVTLVVTAGTSNITIIGARAIQRSSDYTTGGDLFASTLNTDLDSQTIFSQQVAETAQRSLKAAITDSTALNMDLPAAQTRASKLLGFTAGGEPVASNTTVSQLDAAVQSFVSGTGNNAATVIYTPAGTSAVATTVQAKLRQTVSVKDFGAVGNGVADDTVAIQAAIDAVRIGTVYFPAGTYKVTDTINIGLDNVATTINLIGDNPQAPMAGFVWASIINASTLGNKPLFEVGGLALNCDSTAIVGLKLQGPGQNGSIGIKLTNYATAADYRSGSDPGPLPEGSGATIRVAHCMITQFSFGILGLSFLSNIEYNELRDLNEGVVVWPYTNDLRIENNHFYDIINAGIDSSRFSNTAPNVQSGNLIIDGNVFEAQGAACTDININNAIWTTICNNVHGLGSQYCLYISNPGYVYDINWMSVISNKYQGGSTASVVLDQYPTFAAPDYDQIAFFGNSLGSLTILNAPKIVGDVFNQFSSVNTSVMDAGSISSTKGQFAPRTPNVTLISNGNFATNSGAAYTQSNATYPYSAGTVPTGWTVDVSGVGVKLFWDVDGPLATASSDYRASGSQYRFDVRRDATGSAGTVYFYQDITVQANTTYTVVAFGKPTGTSWSLEICNTSNTVLATAATATGTASAPLFAAVSCNSQALTTLRVRFATSDTNTNYMYYVAMYEGYWPVGSIGYPN